MKFYLVHVMRGHFQLFTNKKDAMAYKKEVNPLQVELEANEYEVTQVVIKNKNDVIDLVNRLSGTPDEAWDMFHLGTDEEGNVIKH